ncbi:MAG: hypothetical protein DMF81_24300 [Acidobacteria bacterium]|nr:MAG: hypothetical protein DMF81_24300 [Acidobacteriota bacterium]
MAMNTNILATAAGLSDRDLIARLYALAGRERQASVELVAHLTVLDGRPAVYAALGYGSLFSYCTQSLRLSEDAACNRIEAARACRRSGEMTLTSVRLLARHLTPENHQAVLARASRRSRQEIEALLAELAPRPDVPTLVRRLPALTTTPPLLSAAPAQATIGAASEQTRAVAPTSAAFIPTSRPVVQATAPERYRVQFTIGPETHDKLRRLQGLLRREIPDGDPGAIFDRALTLLLESVEKRKIGATVRPRPGRSIRPETDKPARKHPLNSRDIPREVKRVVWRRDVGQCAFVAATGRRCSERTFLEFHHVQPYARQGPATVANISLRCRRHNQYEGELIFGRHGASIVREV